MTQIELNPAYELVYVSVPEYSRNGELTKLILDAGGIVLDFYTMDMNELTFIAKHRILPAPTIIVHKNNNVVCRIVKNIPSADELAAIINSLC